MPGKSGKPHCSETPAVRQSASPSLPELTMRLALLLALLLLSACSRTPDETRIREAIAGMEAAVETRNPRDFMAHVAEDFTGSDSGLDRAALHNLLRGQFLRNESVGVLLGPIAVTLQGERATAAVTATLSGGSGGWLPERGAIYDIVTGWKRVDGRWLCISASWTQK
jgi:hypothetical protein